MSREATGSDQAASGEADRARGSGRARQIRPDAIKEELWPELEKLGEAQVRQLLSIDKYRGATRFYVEEWLRFKEFPRAREVLGTKTEKPPGNAANRVALAAAGAIVAASLLAHLTLVD